MKTAEVAIEHVLTGVLALCAFALPLLKLLDLNDIKFNSEALIGVLGLAYLFGVVFDKISDTLLSPFDQRLRLRLANKRLKDGKLSPISSDPFPQDVLEYMLRSEGGGRLDWINSLRSRIRTSRGLAVLGLPATLGITIHQVGPENCSRISQSLKDLLPYLTIALNLFFIVVSLLLSTFYQIPRTSKLTTDEARRKKVMARARWPICIRASFYILIQATSVMAICFISHSQKRDDRYTVIAIVGIMSAVFALWVWHRITKTHMSFVSRRLDIRTVNKGL
jgi:hypothetical protein